MKFIHHPSRSLSLFVMLAAVLTVQAVWLSRPAQAQDLDLIQPRLRSDAPADGVVTGPVEGDADENIEIQEAAPSSLVEAMKGIFGKKEKQQVVVRRGSPKPEKAAAAPAESSSESAPPVRATPMETPSESEKQPESSGKPVAKAAPAPAPAEASVEPAVNEDAVLVDKIQGIVLVGDPSKVEADDPPRLNGVLVDDNQLLVPESVAQRTEAFIGKSLSLQRLQEIQQSIVLGYRNTGHPVVDVVVPEQNITGGVLQLVVIVGKLGEVAVEGNTHFDDGFYIGAVRSDRGDVIESGSLTEDLRYLNRNPFRRVDLVYTPGENFGETNVILDVTERRPYSVYAGYEDTGNDFIGRDRFLFGFEAGSILGLDHQFGYQYTTTSEFEGIHAHAWTYRMPLPWWRSEFRLLAGYVTSEADLGEFGGMDLNTSGESSQISGIWVLPLPSVRSVAHDLLLGYDFKSTNNNLEFGGENVFDTTTEIHQFSLGHSAETRSGLGLTRMTNRLVWSPGGLSNHNEDDAFAQDRYQGSADYLYWNGSIDHITYLPGDFRLAFEIEGHVSNENLLASEQFLMGGVHSVRGFEQNVVRADKGVRTSIELYSPQFSLLGWLPGFGPGQDIEEEGKGGKQIVSDTSGLIDRGRLFAFYDYAWGTNVNELPDEQDVSLGGTGLGLDWRLEDYLSARIAYGWQVNQSGFEDDQAGRWHFGVMARW